MTNIQYPRSGLRVRCEQGVNSKVKQACLNFAKWLRLYMEFPIRVVVYLKPAKQIKTIDSKELVSATFFGPFERNVEPYIRVATGDFEDLVSEIGEENAICSILNTMAHELIHYQQWLIDPNFDEEKAEVEAENESRKLIDEYYGVSFIIEIIVHQKVWTIENEKGFPTTISDGEKSMPFWSSELRTQEFIKSVDFYKKYHILEISFIDFVNRWLPSLEKDELIVGTNLKGKYLIGIDWNPKELLEQIKNEIDFY
ncbi:DUF2750 domain-containing protein [Bacillus sp. CECT 9360]|uniref:DUF2750 domain-containing protein n=1 Tax=Bacillus sp. CECT 9360 TaxID=2845821 RepID=UPI001E394F7D|nr:DUF2750 domain-containing protein [Bacillus sp. CECT 9360]CAH0344399.1 hypothetical protein BCI9360_00652 [Bacillus sp. CECT 9360]